MFVHIITRLFGRGPPTKSTAICLFTTVSYLYKKMQASLHLAWYSTCFPKFTNIIILWDYNCDLWPLAFCLVLASLLNTLRLCSASVFSKFLTRSIINDIAQAVLTLSSNAKTALFHVNQWSLFFHQWSPKPSSIVMKWMLKHSLCLVTCTFKPQQS